MNIKRKKANSRSDSSPFTLTSAEELLTISYGKKGTAKRAAAEARISKLVQKLSI